MIIIIFACVLMIFQDVTGTFLVVCESKGRGVLAGMFDALGDFPKWFGAGISGATLAQKGFGAETILVIAVSITSFFSTSLATIWAKRIKAE